MGADLMHFEIAADDLDGLTDFYTRVLRWTVNPGPQGFEDYRIIETSDNKDSIGGGLFKKKSPDQGVIMYFRVDHMERATDTVLESGGQVVDPKTAIKGIGWYSVCSDPEGNMFGLWVDDADAE